MHNLQLKRKKKKKESKSIWSNTACTLVFILISEQSNFKKSKFLVQQES
jgi:hypothetical protein